VILTLLTARPMSHAGEDVTGRNGLTTADVLILIVLVVTVLVPVTDKQITDTLTHLTALKLTLLAV